MEMVKLFQLQLEHYEKVEGRLSLEGKANQLSMMIRGNLRGDAGLGVVPLFAGYDLRRARAACGTSTSPADATRSEFVATGSGSLHAGTVVKLGYSADLPRRRDRPRSCRALWEAADADSATGGPDRFRGHLPGRRDDHRRRVLARSATTTWASHFEPRIARTRSERAGLSHEHAVLRRTRTGDERPGRLRPEGHRTWPRWSAIRYDDGIAMVAENSSATRCARSGEIYDRIAFAGVGRTTSSTSCASPASAPPTSRATSTAGTTSTPAAWPTNTPRSSAQIFTHEMKPMEVEILVAEVGHAARRGSDVPHHLRRHGGRQGRLRRAGRRSPRSRPVTETFGDSLPDGLDLGAAVVAVVKALAGPERAIPATSRGRHAGPWREPSLLQPSPTTRWSRSHRRQRGDERERRRPQQRRW